MIIVVTGGRDRPLPPEERDAFVDFVSRCPEAVIVRHGGASKQVDLPGGLLPRPGEIVVREHRGSYRVRQGIDFLVGHACGAHGIPSERWTPKWHVNGATWYGAGPARNDEMLTGVRKTATVTRSDWTPDVGEVAIGKADILVHWPGGRGTAHCLGRARDRHIRCIPIADLMPPR